MKQDDRLDFLDGSFGPLNSGWEDYDPNEQINVGSDVMDALYSMVENALTDLRVHIPASEIGVVVDQETQDIYVVARGFRVWQSKIDMFELEPTVSSEWLMWPPPKPLVFGLGD